MPQEAEEEKVKDVMPASKRQRVSHEASGEESEGSAVVLDEPAVRRLLFSFDRKVLKIGKITVKFSDNACVFMDSDVYLFTVLQVACRKKRDPVSAADEQDFIEKNKYGSTGRRVCRAMLFFPPHSTSQRLIEALCLGAERCYEGGRVALLLHTLLWSH